MCSQGSFIQSGEQREHLDRSGRLKRSVGSVDAKDDLSRASVGIKQLFGRIPLSLSICSPNPCVASAIALSSLGPMHRVFIEMFGRNENRWDVSGVTVWMFVSWMCRNPLCASSSVLLPERISCDINSISA